MNEEQFRKSIDDRLKASRDAALRELNRTESWAERHPSAIGWIIAGAVVVVIGILCKACS